MSSSRFKEKGCEYLSYYLPYFSCTKEEYAYLIQEGWINGTLSNTRELIFKDIEIQNHKEICSLLNEQKMCMRSLINLYDMYPNVYDKETFIQFAYNVNVIKVELYTYSKQV